VIYLVVIVVGIQYDEGGGLCGRLAGSMDEYLTGFTQEEHCGHAYVRDGQGGRGDLWASRFFCSSGEILHLVAFNTICIYSR